MLEKLTTLLSIATKDEILIILKIAKEIVQQAEQKAPAAPRSFDRTSQ